MNKILFVCAIAFLLLNSCASLTKSQVETVNHFAHLGNHFSAFPSKILTALADLRVKRGVYFANSLDDVNPHMDELNNLYAAKKDDYKASAKADITFKIIDKYAQSLLLLSSDKHTADLDSQAISFGANLDNLITTYNTIPNVKPAPGGLGGVVGSVIMAGGKQLVRSEQAKALQDFIPKSDTLIGIMTGNLLEFLQSTDIDFLIKNEEKGIQSNYKSFLTQLSLNKGKPTIQNERDYLELKADLDHIKTLRDQTIDATKDLRKAHAKLLEEIKEKKDLKEIIAELQTLYDDVARAKATISSFNAAKN